MNDAFEAALDIILKAEGGFSNDKRDKGGMTSLGVTKANWDAWCGHTTTEADMRALTRAKVAPFYRANYWNVVQADHMPGAVGLCVFDFSVTSSPARAARYIQRLVRTGDDGHIGPESLNAVKKWVLLYGVAETVRGYQNERRAYYRSLGNPTFIKGWLKRCDEVESAALRYCP